MGPRGNLYVGEQYSVRIVTPEGQVSTLAGSARPGFVESSGEAARFAAITGISVSPGGDVFVTDAANYRIRKVASDGTVTTIAGNGKRKTHDGAAKDASFYWPTGIAVDDHDTLYIMDMIARDNWGFSVRKITPDGTVSTIVVIPEELGFSRDGHKYRSGHHTSELLTSSLAALHKASHPDSISQFLRYAAVVILPDQRVI